mgnify:FL=1
MIFSAVLDRKIQLEDIVDLGSPTFRIPDTFRGAMYEVEPSQIARPDLLSYDLYGDELYADILCKLNGISNPLELNEGMIIIIPSPDDLDKFVINSPNLDYRKPQRARKTRPNSPGKYSKRFTYDPVTKIVVY